MDHTPWEDEKAWWFDFNQAEHPDLVDLPYPSDIWTGVQPKGDLLAYLDEHPGKWFHVCAEDQARILTIRICDPDFAFAFKLRWSGAPVHRKIGRTK
jgi:hypothetical protein